MLEGFLISHLPICKPRLALLECPGSHPSLISHLPCLLRRLHGISVYPCACTMGLHTGGKITFGCWPKPLSGEDVDPDTCPFPPCAWLCLSTPTEAASIRATSPAGLRLPGCRCAASTLPVLLGRGGGRQTAVPEERQHTVLCPPLAGHIKPGEVVPCRMLSLLLPHLQTLSLPCHCLAARICSLTLLCCSLLHLTGRNSPFPAQGDRGLN